MSLQVQHLNADATFLLTFSRHPDSTPAAEQFTLLIDPWLHSDAPVIHRKFSNQEHTVAGAYSSLQQLPHVPSGILVTQDKSDHVHEGTLKDLNWDTCETVLYAVPDAARIVRSWSWFPQSRLIELQTSKPLRIVAGKDEYIELEFLPAKHIWEIPALHSAVGVKHVCTGDIVASVLATPHGSPLSCARAWLNGLPDKRLDLLLHPLNRVETPLWLGGLISSGYPAGEEICKAAAVKTWISSHDENKKVTGFVASRIKKRCWSVEEAQKEYAELGPLVMELGVGEVVEVLRGR